MTSPTTAARRATRVQAWAGGLLIAVFAAASSGRAIAAGQAFGELPGRIAAAMDSHSPVILGEIHGTAEVPALVGAVLASRLANGGAVSFALEIPDSHQAALDAWLDDTARGPAAAALADHPFWSYMDGRSSEAMLDLLEQVRRWRQAGAAVDLLAFDVPDPSVGGALRERYMADRLERALAMPQAPPMLVLTGNLHARRAVGNPFDPDVELMAWHLRDRPAMTLDVRALQGSAWICAPGCGARELGVDRSAPATGLRLFGRASAQGYDGELVLPRFTASPPAFPAGRSVPHPAD